MCVLLQISFAAVLPNILFKLVNNTHSNRKNKKGARFFETQCIFSWMLTIVCCLVVG